MPPKCASMSAPGKIELNRNNMRRDDRADPDALETVLFITIAAAYRPSTPPDAPTLTTIGPESRLKRFPVSPETRNVASINLPPTIVSIRLPMASRKNIFRAR